MDCGNKFFKAHIVGASYRFSGPQNAGHIRLLTLGAQIMYGYKNISNMGTAGGILEIPYHGLVSYKF